MNENTATNDPLAGDSIASSLAGLSEWDGADASVWRRVWDHEHRARAWWRSTRVWGLTAAAALVLVSGTVVWSGVGLPRDNRASVGAGAVARRAERTMGLAAAPVEGAKQYEERVSGDAAVRAPASIQAGAGEVVATSAPPALLTGVASNPGRFVVRRATLELETKDIHAVFAKAMHVVQPAMGEYVEASSIAGEGQETRAELTLRVTSDRLSAVLNELRGFAVVASEQAGGQDITDQVVDIDARLRNEQRIEQELLTLLTSKKDASLEDILRVQQELSRVREQIERMQAQRDSLSRLTSLATVLVIVRHEGGPTQPAPNGFGDAIRRAWSRGVDDLGGLVGAAVRLAVGGLPFWIVLGGGALVGWRVWKRRRNSLAYEPAPSISN